ncbi:Hpt domain-containing protein [Microlunatus speluncae]|uniref:Hpt domain-containing protein n=1 Tax=Microlunatus speluncae TaxID=2594267 RepID=UPI001375A08D|nr:Hpt domain-containing protein [Microlunatus speluncae]
MSDPSGVPDPTTEAVFNSISAQAQETNRIRVTALDQLIQELPEDGSAADGRRRAKDLAHQIAGSAGTFGNARASELAREMEQLLTGEIDATAASELRTRVAALLEALG